MYFLCDGDADCSNDDYHDEREEICPGAVSFYDEIKVFISGYRCFTSYCLARSATMRSVSTLYLLIVRHVFRFEPRLRWGVHIYGGNPYDRDWDPRRFWPVWAQHSTTGLSRYRSPVYYSTPQISVHRNHAKYATIYVTHPTRPKNAFYLHHVFMCLYNRLYNCSGHSLDLSA